MHCIAIVEKISHGQAIVVYDVTLDHTDTAERINNLLTWMYDRLESLYIYTPEIKDKSLIVAENDDMCVNVECPVKLELDNVVIDDCFKISLLSHSIAEQLEIESCQFHYLS